MPKTNRAASTALTPEAIAESIAADETIAPEPVALYALGLGDDALVLAHRLGEWIANAPELEEDVALGNIGLDLLGHARSLLTYAGSAWGKSEDDLAYFRGESEFRNRQLFEQPNGDFAQTIARQLYASVYFDELYRALRLSSDPTLAAIAAKATKEVDYHLDHSVQWLLRLGLGTEESHRRMQRGLDAMWPFVGELFHPEAATDVAGPVVGVVGGRVDGVVGGPADGVVGGPADGVVGGPVDGAAGALVDGAADGLVDGVAVDPERLRAAFDELVPRLISDAGLTVPTVPFARGGGREGRHTESLGPMLAEMQVLARAHPGVTW
ncbi:1,2-phenylacetyl-CoA epoxidase subunit PaaC [Herbiconiux wuyangfengii]|uniref:1,2-phenylacetyl-CoA epoxidase subunit PaaC n=1 Tax=Herbiconiux wuyangfengii TaxID=3342794 RepID=UPI003CFA4F82